MLTVAVILVGAGLQRVTGMGFSLVSAPLLVLVLGPRDGVALAIGLSVLANAVVLWRTHRDVSWRKAMLLLIPGVVGILPGWWLNRQMSAPALAILVGSVILTSLVAVTFWQRARVFKGRAGTAAAGALSGFMNVTASASGPAIVLYAVSTNWRHAEFVATVQAYFLALNLASLAAHTGNGVPPTTWAITAIACLVGVVVGDRLAPHINHETARKLVIVVALAGSAATIIRGVTELI